MTVEPSELEAIPYSTRLAERDELLRLYERAFPPNERVALWKLRAIALLGRGEFTAYRHGGRFCGFTFATFSDELAFVLFLAVDDSQRSKGYGSAIIGKLRERSAGRPIVLEIEPLDPDAPNYGQRVRRLAFYERNGFGPTGYDVIDSGDRYTMLSTGEGLDVPAFEAAVRRMSLGLHRIDVVLNRGRV